VLGHDIRDTLITFGIRQAAAPEFMQLSVSGRCAV